MRVHKFYTGDIPLNRSYLRRLDFAPRGLHSNVVAQIMDWLIWNRLYGVTILLDAPSIKS